MKRNPIVVTNAIVSLVGSGAVLLTAFGFSLTAEQVGAISAFILTAGGVIAALFGQAQVDSPDTVERKVLEAIDFGQHNALEQAVTAATEGIIPRPPAKPKKVARK